MSKIVLFKMRGGSHAYGLDTPTSDVDYRGVFAHADVSHIFGIQSGLHDNEVKQNDQEDSAMWELRRFFKLLQGGNSQAVEMLFSEAFGEQCHRHFKLLFNHRPRLIDGEKFFKVLRGYAQSERLLANGERTGKLGGKRKEALDKYGFSPKNFVQLFRLLWAGGVFYDQGIFPVRVRNFDLPFHEYLMDVKTHPEKFQVSELNAFAGELEIALEDSYKHSSVKSWKFEPEIADGICHRVYSEILNDLYKYV